MRDIESIEFPPFPGGPPCNRCGQKRLKVMRRGQRGRGFSSFYCDDPEWGHDCWERVSALLEYMMGPQCAEDHLICVCRICGSWYDMDFMEAFYCHDGDDDWAIRTLVLTEDEARPYGYIAPGVDVHQ